MFVFIREFFRDWLIQLHWLYLTRILHMKIHRTAKVSLSARLDKAYPVGIIIKDGAYVAGGARVFAHDYCRGINTETVIGTNNFIGADAIIMPGVVLGENVVVGAGAVVTRNVESGCVVAGNPAKILREGIELGVHGQMIR